MTQDTTEKRDFVSVAICTYNRGSIVAPLGGLLESDYPNFEIIVMDQSTNDDTEEVLYRHINNPQVRYIRTNSRGLGWSRKEVLEAAKGDLVLFTDDDCIVTENWISTIVRIFHDHPQVSVVCSNVLPAEHDKDKGYIAHHIEKQDVLMTKPSMLQKSRGIGAALCVRKSAVMKIGGFDPSMGSGSPLSGGEDIDILVRALALGQHVYLTTEVSVLHYGFRTWEQGRKLWREDYFCVAFAYAKMLRINRWDILPVIVDRLWGTFWPAMIGLLQFKRPRGLSLFVETIRGLRAGLRTPIDKTTLLWQSPKVEEYAPKPMPERKPFSAQKSIPSA